jgi:hypothetical protein
MVWISLRVAAPNRKYDFQPLLFDVSGRAGCNRIAPTTTGAILHELELMADHSAESSSHTACTLFR